MSVTASLRRPLWWTALRHPIFLVALAIKIGLSALLVGPVMRDWFAPFVDYFVRSGFQDPWQHYLTLGQPKAFPYPPGMLWVFALPRWLGSPLLAAEAGALGTLQLLLMRLPLLLADIGIYLVLGAWFKERVASVRLWYWCSPVVMYVCYVHGQLDLIPTALLFCSLYWIERRASLVGMLIFGLALSTKNHLWVALPFVLIYLKPQMNWPRLLGLTLLPLVIYGAILGPWAGSAAFQAMVLRAEEQRWIFEYALPVGRFGTVFLLCPAVLLFIVAKYAGYPRHNWDLTILFMGIAFCAFVVLVPPMPGWYLWSLPFAVYFFCRFPSRNAGLIWIFSAAYIAYFVLGERSDLPEAYRLIAGKPLALSLAFTLMQGSLLAVGALMYTRGVRSNEVYGRRQRALMLGIAGDSGVGKDRLAQGLTALLGKDDVIQLAGDDYHRWERGDKNWKVLTHLDPKSNRLHEQLEHTIALSAGQGILKGSYDHGTGRFLPAEAVDPRKNIIVQGLHTFLLERMREVFDLRVFLDPDESLRKFWKLQRDHQERGQSVAKALKSLRQRKSDRLKVVLPQREHADLIFCMRAAKPADLRDRRRDPELVLVIEASNSFNLEGLAASLDALPKVSVSVEYPKGLSRIRLRVRADKAALSAIELEAVARERIQNLSDLVGSKPFFTSGLDGVMTLTTLLCLATRIAWNGAALEPLRAMES